MTSESNTHIETTDLPTPQEESPKTTNAAVEPALENEEKIEKVETTNKRKAEADESVTSDKETKEKDSSPKKTKTSPKEKPAEVLPPHKEKSLEGLKVCVTGTLDCLGRKGVETLIKNCGGILSSTVTTDTEYLVIATKPGDSKIARAKKLEKKALSEAEFLELINPA